MNRTILAAAVLAISGCATVPPAAGKKLDTSVPSECRAHCDSLGWSSGRW